MRKDEIHLPIIPDQIAEPLRQFILRRHLFLPPAYMVDPVQLLLLIQLLPLLPKPWISSLQNAAGYIMALRAAKGKYLKSAQFIDLSPHQMNDRRHDILHLPAAPL